MIETWIPYCGPAPLPAELWTRWNADPVVMAILVLLAALAIGRMGGAGRMALLAAVGVLALVFLSPLCALSSALFTARTLHHLLLMLAAAPLIALAAPRLPRRSLWLSVAVQATVLWAWHAPQAYAAALSHDGLYWLMQASILGAAVWFWAAVRAAPATSALAGLLAAMLLMGLLGAVITFAGAPLYAPHFASTLAWGLTPLEDQQAAGLIMWAPAALAYLVVALFRLNQVLAPRDRAPA